MPRWILGVLIFLVLLFASIFALVVLLLWLMLRRKNEAAHDVEVGYADGEEYEATIPALVIAAPELEAEELEVRVQEVDLDEDVYDAEVEAEAPDLDVHLPEVDVEAPELGVEAAVAAVAAADLDLDAPEVDVDLPAVDADVPELEEAPGVGAEMRGLEPELPETDADVQVAEAEPVAVAAAEPPVPDDLKRIEGIGPKISSVLQAAGITTFAQLAATDVGTIEGILEAESPRLLRLAHPATWPEQAAVAATGDPDALKELQGSLHAGRRKY